MASETGSTRSPLPGAGTRRSEPLASTWPPSSPTSLASKLERKVWLPIAAVLTLVGGILIAVAGPNNFGVAAIGSIITFFGFNLWVPMTCTWSTENYPTRARATGFALVDGIGHLGGGVGILVIAPLIPTLVASLGLTTGPVVVFVIIAAFLIVAAIIAQCGTATRQKRLDEVSP